MVRERRALLRVLGPGILIAATGVGAGDLATGALSGSLLGLSCLWAVVVGAGLKFVLTEGLARFQLATGETLIEGVMRRTARWARYLFLLYLLPWSWFVGSALVSACGVTAHALVPVFDSPVQGKIAFGILHSLLGLVLVLRGGFRLFERMMSVAIALMFVTVVVTAVLLRPDWGAVLNGMIVPSVPADGGEGAAWTIALIGGVGGTLTILCYGYWIREEGRKDTQQLRLCRLDLGVGYLMTAIFGIGMVIIGSTIRVEGRGAGLVVQLGEALEGPLGNVGRLLFITGAWAAVFSSLVGVWQAVPYIFADFWRLRDAPRDGDPAGTVDTRSKPYRFYLYALAGAPLLGLFVSFKQIQLAYAVIGALFLPGLALVLISLNSRRVIGPIFRNRAPTLAVLVLTVMFFVYFSWTQLAPRF